MVIVIIESTKKTRVGAHTSRYTIMHNQPYITAQEGIRN